MNRISASMPHILNHKRVSHWNLFFLFSDEYSNPSIEKKMDFRDSRVLIHKNVSSEFCMTIFLQQVLLFEMMSNLVWMPPQSELR